MPRAAQLRLHPKLPIVDSDPKSYALMVRDGIMARVKILPWFKRGSFHYSTNKAKQIQPQDIPFCGVYFIEELGTPDGDANAGEPRFRTTVRIGFSVIVQNNDTNKAEYHLDTAYSSLTRGLLCDPTLYNNREFKIQAFTRGSRAHVFGSTGLENELPIAELRWDLTCDLGTITYEPLVPDMLEVVHLDGRPIGHDDVPLAGAQMDIETE